MILFPSEMNELEYIGAARIAVNPLKAEALDAEILRAARLRRWLLRSKLTIHEAIERALR